MLADLHAGHLGGDRLELAAHLRRGVRLEVERVDVAGAAGEEDEDHRLRPRPPRAGRTPGRGNGPVGQEGGQADPEQARVADLQEFAPRDAEGVPRSFAGGGHSSVSVGGREVAKSVRRVRTSQHPIMETHPCQPSPSIFNDPT